MAVVIKCSELGTLMGKNIFMRHIDKAKRECVERSQGVRKETDLARAKRELSDIGSNLEIEKVIENISLKSVSDVSDVVMALKKYDYGKADKIVTSFVQHRVNTMWGVQNESNSFARLLEIERFKSMVRLPGKFMHIGCNGKNEFFLRGQLDGWVEETNTIVEIKNRIKKFYVCEHELIQLRAYMLLYGAEKGVLVQDFNGEFQFTEVDLELDLFKKDIELLISTW